MKIIVFCGLSITAGEGSKILDAEFRPPAKHGDLISSVYADNPDVIVVIDGAFIDNLSVWHNEINEALNKGVAVYGASAMGAVRAAEMQSWGMRGIGKVFHLISNGTIEADDEVLCDFSVDDGIYHKKTLSIVNLRFILSEAAEARLINQIQSDAILASAKALFYRERTLDKILAESMANRILDHEEADLLRNHISRSDTDIQKQDAIECLETVSRLRIEDLDKTGKNFQYDLFFEALYERDRGTKNGAGYHPFYKIANDYVMYASDIESMNDAALNRKICALVAENFNIEVSGEEVLREKTLFLKKCRPATRDDCQEWLKENDLTEGEFNDLMAERVKVNKVQNWYRTRLGFAKNTRYLLEELKLNNQYAGWKQKSIEIHESLKANQEDIASAYNEADINHLAVLFLKRNSRSWKHAPFDFIKKIGLNPNAFKHLLAMDKTLSDLVNQALFDPE